MFFTCSILLIKQITNIQTKSRKKDYEQVFWHISHSTSLSAVFNDKINVIFLILV